MLFIVLTAAVLAQGTFAAEHPTRFDPKRDAAKDFQNALAEAKTDGKRVLLDVGGEWCIWCRRLDTLFATHTDLDSFLRKNFVLVKINYSRENENEAFLSRYPQIPGYPHFFVLDNDGRFLCSQDTGELESGKGHDPMKVLAFLEKWAPDRSKAGSK